MKQKEAKISISPDKMEAVFIHPIRNGDSDRRLKKRVKQKGSRCRSKFPWTS
ncbi:hypothetical protein [Halobacillus trueperi]|uniref:hypothetical protein n=1 Tax=Halobacillus trueperi TaxID=156205 RepID=UPI0037359571